MAQVFVSISSKMAQVNISIYNEHMSSYDLYSMADLLTVHRYMMKELVPEAGCMNLNLYIRFRMETAGRDDCGIR